jgi:hypothetical protein
MAGRDGVVSYGNTDRVRKALSEWPRRERKASGVKDGEHH